MYLIEEVERSLEWERQCRRSNQGEMGKEEQIKMAVEEEKEKEEEEEEPEEEEEEEERKRLEMIALVGRREMVERWRGEMVEMGTKAQKERVGSTRKRGGSIMGEGEEEEGGKGEYKEGGVSNCSGHSYRSSRVGEAVVVLLS